MFNIWREEGFPRTDDNVSYNRYIFARKKFRSLVKKYKNQSTIEHYINVEKLKKTKPKSYWKQIKLAKSTTTKLYTINGKTVLETFSSEIDFSHLPNGAYFLEIANEHGKEIHKIIKK